MAIAIPVPSAQDPARTISKLFIDFERAQPDPEGRPPRLLVAMPSVWANKYQILLYSAAAKHRFVVVGARADDLDKIFWPGPVVLHTHWFASIVNDAGTENEAEARMNRAWAQIEAFRERTGASLLWTAHNVFPHGNRFPETFLNLRRRIFDTFDAIHVMDDGHVPILETAFGRSAPQHFTVPHMTYDGAMLDSMGKDQARAHFGLPSDAVVFGFFGSLQGYKGVDSFLTAFDKLSAETSRPVRALVGGIPSDTELVKRLQIQWGNRSDIRLLARKIHDHEVQYLHRASDVMVLPYSGSLNSGAALMAATFRTPFLIPDQIGATALNGLGEIRYDGSHPEGLWEAMVRCIDGISARFDPDALAQRAPGRVSETFFAELDRKLASTDSAQNNKSVIGED